MAELPLVVPAGAASSRTLSAMARPHCEAAIGASSISRMATMRSMMAASMPTGVASWPSTPSSGRRGRHHLHRVVLVEDAGEGPVEAAAPGPLGVGAGPPGVRGPLPSRPQLIVGVVDHG